MNQNFLTLAADAGDGTAQVRIGQAAHDCIDVLPTPANDAVPGSDALYLALMRVKGGAEAREKQTGMRAWI